MTSCSRQKELMRLLLGEFTAEAAEELRRHAEECPFCGKEYRQLTAVHELLKAAPRPQPPEELYREYMRSLRVRFEPKKQPFFERLFRRLPAFSLKGAPLQVGLGYAAVLVIGILIGTLLHRPEPAPTTVALSSTAADEQTRLIADYLAGSEVLLLSLLNTPADSLRHEDWLFNRESARMLLSRMPSIQRNPLLSEDETARMLLAHIELVLLEISNLPESELPRAVSDLQTLLRQARTLQTARQVQAKLRRSAETGV